VILITAHNLSAADLIGHIDYKAPALSNASKLNPIKYTPENDHHFFIFLTLKTENLYDYYQIKKKKLIKAF